jgi:hypothetical protein
MFLYFLRTTFEDSSKYKTDRPDNLVGAQQGIGMSSGSRLWANALKAKEDIRATDI